MMCRGHRVVTPRFGCVSAPQRNTDDTNQQTYFHYKSPTSKHDGVHLPGFTPIQIMLDKWIINRKVSNVSQILLQMQAEISNVASCLIPINESSVDIFPAFSSLQYAPQFVEVAPFPQTAFKHNQFYTFASNVLAMFFMISFLFPASRLIRALVLEKETKVMRLWEHLSSFGVVP
jgi:hypothetical protein